MLMFGKHIVVSYPNPNKYYCVYPFHLINVTLCGFSALFVCSKIAPAFFYRLPSLSEMCALCTSFYTQFLLAVWTAILD